MKSVFFQSGYLWHRPCARLDEFPRRGKMVPDTIMSDAAEVTYTCEMCGFTFVEKRQKNKKGGGKND